jgi:hypothetical protein
MPGHPRSSRAYELGGRRRLAAHHDQAAGNVVDAVALSVPGHDPVGALDHADGIGQPLKVTTPSPWRARCAASGDDCGTTGRWPSKDPAGAERTADLAQARYGSGLRCDNRVCEPVARPGPRGRRAG